MPPRAASADSGGPRSDGGSSRDPAPREPTGSEGASTAAGSFRTAVSDPPPVPGDSAIQPSIPTPSIGFPDTSIHVGTIGVKRTAFGRSGRALTVLTNHFEVKIPEHIIFHYDEISSSNKTLPARFNMEIVEMLQTKVAPEVFSPRVVYDGRKNIFSPRILPFPSGSQEFRFALNDTITSKGGDQGEERAEGEEGAHGGGVAARGRGPKLFSVKLTHVAAINPELLDRFVKGKQSHDSAVLTAITALNVVIRMEPTMRYPFNTRSFFTPRETSDIGGGIVLWRGFFQSVRPAIGRMLINVDISTAAMYKPGHLVDMSLEVLEMTSRGPLALSPARGLPERERIKLQRFFSGVRVNVNIPGQPSTGRRPPRVIKRLTKAGASGLSFAMHDGETITVAAYFEKTHNYRLQFPDIVCIEVTSGAIFPMEFCTIPDGQIMRKQLPPEKVKHVVAFATKRPHERLESIRAALGILNYSQSEYIQHFGMHVKPDAHVEEVRARVLAPPTLMYGDGSRQPTITPRDGFWNMVNRRFHRPTTINRWVVVVFEREQRFNRITAQEMVHNFIQQFAALGIKCHEDDPLVLWENPSNVSASLHMAGRKVIEKHKNKGPGPDLIVVVLPESSSDIYHTVKHFGDITRGVATQCLKGSKCNRGNRQYFANVCLKINVKVGGINTVLEARSVPSLTDPRNPTLVMGADITHPAPGADGRPSFTSLVGNVDSETAKYVAECRVQMARKEMIDTLEEMATAHIALYKRYQQGVEKKKSPDPTRVIFFRDGVSEGEFKQVLEHELPQLKRALAANNVNAKLTIVVVGKMHHVRFFPKHRQDGDRTGNCPAGTVVDNDITHPTEFDFYLQILRVYTLLGTSRPAHYTVLYDENNFTPDALQALSFALCHVYARCTRSVSIPAPVYYAHLVCARAKNHYNPDGERTFDFTEYNTDLASGDAKAQVDAFMSNFMPLHEKTKRSMYFC